LLGAISSASAADLPTKAPPYIAPVAVPPNWSGFYVGLNAGGVWSDTNMDWRLNPVGFGPSGVLFEQAAAGHLRTSGFTGGGQIGLNKQFDMLVFGLKATCSTRVCRAVEAAAQLFLPEFSTASHSQWRADGSVRLAAGWASRLDPGFLMRPAALRWVASATATSASFRSFRRATRRQ
jgi:hypothetical protein